MQQVNKAQAVCLLTSVLFIISVSLLYLKVHPHIPIFLCIILFMMFSLFTKRPWSFIEEAIKKGLNVGVIPIFLFMLIGILIGIWMLSGTIPTLIYYGSHIMSVNFFLPSVFIITAIVGTFLGSAFTTASTIGVAMLAIGTMMGLSPAMIAGAIISGAFLGDKMSPLSDTTNIAAAISRVDLFEHIRHMLWTTVPASILCLIGFGLMGWFSDKTTVENVTHVQDLIEGLNIIHPMSMIPAIVMLVLAWRRTPAILVIVAGILTGIASALIFQQSVSLTAIMDVMQNGYVADTGNEKLDSMLSRGGLQSMMWSVSLVLLTLTMGGLIQALGIMERLMEIIQKLIISTGRLVFATAVTAIGINVSVGEQYLSIILTGKVYEEQFDARGISRKNLSRILEDAGTVINPLIPYGVSGVFLANVLGVPVLQYLPFALFCLVSPLLTILYGFTGISLRKNELSTN
ncbi:Na+/H+ antiporter NhaC [Salirhabdus salicampi]|uniref:Na+/H+ antiporter NhaC n=1 Tax=Salirhabdus salicampi TaxID=476102 RepID=UPI0020C43285|nr:Na+/H+ antiporter NhaC [Salirhabdus salicampi]MCP8615655.1 Na+/H+ antiporter NhaC [Salirhabdus salicampi]